MEKKFDLLMETALLHTNLYGDNVAQPVGLPFGGD
jgi:hypothetical protein